MKAEFSISNNDMFWSIYDWNDETRKGETIRWSGYNDAFWWNKVSVSDQFQIRIGPVTGKRYRLNPQTQDVTVEDASDNPEQPR